MGRPTVTEGGGGGGRETKSETCRSIDRLIDRKLHRHIDRSIEVIQRLRERERLSVWVLNVLIGN